MLKAIIKQLFSFTKHHLLSLITFLDPSFITIFNSHPPISGKSFPFHRPLFVPNSVMFAFCLHHHDYPSKWKMEKDDLSEMGRRFVSSSLA
ncbi:hypothetical protein CEXT_39441 [Caerostris extrusa]|uniref:Uncharacterized protein n=1 Tax=Caerostris extrusa TaxID=172846 RepID=A0AAV4NZ13_CAEEX|nr:hypothetical protein CEXT_39441 [Caerostris extrusa]